ncbi:MAG TPA: AMP-binding protein [Bacteroidales bacterium]|nr:AMP-binding protein [Bacteroidales bacterium]HSA43054.1 AMP-binding protein [Bacteroidales bacterium]
MTAQNNGTLQHLLGQAVQIHAEKAAFSFMGETPLTYRQLGEQVEALRSFFQRLGMTAGCKVAILGHNSPNWAVAYFAITGMGAVAVPLLPDFSQQEISNILDHSEAVALLVSDRLSYKIGEMQENAIRHVIRLDDFNVISTDRQGVAFNPGEKAARLPELKETDLAAIIYTSGTTGKQKGVMLTHGNIISNADAGSKVQPIDHTDVFLSLLPLSHVYENTLGLVLPVYRGASVVYFRQLLSPQLIAEGLQRVRPTIILSVPLIIEKMYRNRILPGIRSGRILRTLYHVPFFRKLINKGAGKKLMNAFGGRVRFFGVGGAKLDPVVEKFLLEARFPVAIGYGLTETSPLLAGTNPGTARHQSTGPAVDRVELRLANVDPVTGQGEIQARGPNIMLGYYKDPEMTAEVITPDGWLKTGDLGAFDRDGFLYIRGRLKNTILGANGENIYPEEIESVINNFKHVVESVVVEQKGKLVALVHLNMEEIEKTWQQLSRDMQDKLENMLDELKLELIRYVNARVNKFSRLHAVVIHHEPFQKTATQKIKRYLYYQQQSH